MNWADEPRELTVRERARVRGMGYRRVDEWRGFHVHNFGTWARALAFRAEQKLRDQHICTSSMSSLNCGACNRGVPYPHPKTMDEILAVMTGRSP